MSLSPRGRFILKATFGYAGLASAWVLLSDQMLAGLIDTATVTMLASGKGLAFVAVTSVLLAVALHVVPPAEAAPPPVEPRDRSRLLAALALSVVSIGAIGTLAFQIQSQAVREEQWSQLQAVARLEVETISRWLDDRLRIARAVSANPTVLAAFERWKKTGNTTDFQRLHANLLNLVDKFGFLRVEIRDISGGLLIDTGTALTEGGDIQGAIDKSIRTHQAGFFDLHRDTENGPIYLGIVAPLIGDGSAEEPLGVLVLTMSPEDFLYPYLRTWPRPSATGETALVRPEGNDILFIGPLRHRPDAALSLRLPLASPDLPAAISVRAGGPITVEGRDYRDVPVLATALPVSGTPWTLVAKVDEAEALAGIRRLAGLTAALALGALALAGAAIGFLWQRQQLAAALRDADHGRALEASEAKFRSYVEGCPVALFVADAEGRYVDCNPAALDLVGYDAATLKEMRIPMLHPEEDREEVFRDFAMFVRDGHIHHDYRLQRRDGSLVWVQLRTVPLADGHVMGFCMDITEQKLAAAALRDSEARFSTVFHASPIAIGLGLMNGELLDVNQAWLDLVGYDRDEVIGRTTAELGIYERPEDRREVIETLNSRGKVSNLELPYRRKNGERIVAQYSAEVVEISGKPHLMVMASDITRRKAEAIALRRYGEIVERLADPVVFFDCAERYVTVNHAYSNLIGKDAADMLGQRMEDVIAPEAYSVAESHMKAAVAGECQNYVLDRFFPDGRRHVFDIRLAPFLVGDEVQGVVANMHEITELRQAQDTLEAAQAMARMGSWSMDVATGTYTTSPTSRQHLGWLGRDISEANLLPFIHPEDMALRQAAWQAAMAGAPYDIEHRMVIHGRTIWVHVKARVEFDADGRPVKATGMTQDITAKREAQQALEAYKDHLEDLVAARTMEMEAAEAKMRLILESSGDGLFGVDTSGRVTFVNRAACALLGYTAEQILGTNCHQMFHFAYPDGSPYPEEDCPIRVTLRGGKGARCEDDVFWHADGRALPVSYSTHPMSQDGRIVGAVVSFVDISERRRSDDAREAALAEAERLAQVRREFLANMSHEIRTPLTAVLGLAQVGRLDSDGRKTAQTFGKILDAGQTLLGVVDDILDFSKIEAGKFKLERQPLSLAEVVDRAVGLVAVRAYAKGLDMRVAEAFDLPAACLGDALRLAQMLGNLLSNAVKFTNPNGAVALTVGRDGGWLVFQVIDSGIGMTPDQMARLFQPFEQADSSTTRHFGGTGLGLAITKEMVELMGGTIAATSSLGEGSTFTLRLPLLEVVAEEPPPLSVPDSVVLAGLSEAEASPLLATLRRHGAEVTLLPSGKAVPASAGLVVTTAEVAAEWSGLVVVESALVRGLRVVVATTPGGVGIAADLAERVAVVERPLRARHLLAVPSTVPLVSVPGRPRLEGYRVLVAEDNEVNRLVLAELLTLEGADLDCVENGRLAMERLGQRGSDAYDIVISDIQMPDMDGYEVARRIAALDPSLPVIGLTAHAMPEERERCIAAGMLEHLAKPVTMDRLVPIILRHARQAPHDRRQPLIDRNRLKDRYGDRAAFIAKLLATVRTTHAGTAAELRAAARDGDLLRLSVMAHTIKGSAGNLAASALLDLAQQTEDAARAGRGETAVTLAIELAATIEALLVELAEETP